MEKTHVYVVSCMTAHMFSLGGGSSNPHAVFYSKAEAEFFAWKKNKETRGDRYDIRIYSVDSIPVMSAGKTGKEFKEFVNERTAELDAKIASKESHAETDGIEATALRSEREALNDELV